jgi:hypothetical protein
LSREITALTEEGGIELGEQNVCSQLIEGISTMMTNLFSCNKEIERNKTRKKKTLLKIMIPLRTHHRIKKKKNLSSPNKSQLLLSKKRHQGRLMIRE